MLTVALGALDWDIIPVNISTALYSRRNATTSWKHNISQQHYLLHFFTAETVHSITRILETRKIFNFVVQILSLGLPSSWTCPKAHTVRPAVSRRCPRLPPFHRMRLCSHFDCRPPGKILHVRVMRYFFYAVYAGLFTRNVTIPVRMHLIKMSITITTDTMHSKHTLHLLHMNALFWHLIFKVDLLTFISFISVEMSQCLLNTVLPIVSASISSLWPSNSAGGSGFLSCWTVKETISPLLFIRGKQICCLFNNDEHYFFISIISLSEMLVLKARYESKY